MIYDTIYMVANVRVVVPLVQVRLLPLSNNLVDTYLRTARDCSPFFISDGGGDSSFLKNYRYITSKLILLSVIQSPFSTDILFI